MSNEHSLKGKGYSMISCNAAVEASRISKIYSGGLHGVSALFSNKVLNPYTGSLYNRPINALNPAHGAMQQIGAGGVMNIFGKKN